MIKVGFVFTGRVGTGLVVARLPDGRWSAPSAIATAGVGWGAQIGGEITDFVIILNTKRECIKPAYCYYLTYHYGSLMASSFARNRRCGRVLLQGPSEPRG